MKSAFWRSIAVVALVAVPMMANANDASIGSEVANNAMSDATLMNTTAIFNAFPHMVVENGTGVELNNFDDGQGRVWWEAYDNLWLNMNVGRMDYGLSGTDFMWGAGSPGTPFGAVFEDNTWLNLGIARPLSGGGAWAVGAILAPFGGTELKGGLPELENNETGYGFNASWGNGNGMHLAGELAFSTEEQIDNTAATKDEYSAFAFGINGRYDTARFIYQANFYMGNGTDKGDSFPDEEKGSGLGVLVNAGRYLKNDASGQATVEFGLGYQSTSFEVAAFSLDGSDFFFPAVRVAAWEQISDRFGLMGGVAWGHGFTSLDDGTVELSGAGSQFDWSAGLYFQPNERVRIDARLEEDNLDYLLSLGNDQPLVMYIGATVGLN